MRARRTRFLVLGIACACTASCVLLACAGPSQQTAADGGTVDAASPTLTSDAGGYQFPCLEPNTRSGAPTFTALYREVFCTAGCASLYCHGSRGTSGNLNLETLDLAYAQLVDAPASTALPADGTLGCRRSGLLRVERGSPERSLLFLKVRGDPPCGAPMPPPGQGFAALTPAQLEQLRTWIVAGAPDDRVLP